MRTITAELFDAKCRCEHWESCPECCQTAHAALEAEPQEPVVA